MKDIVANGFPKCGNHALVKALQLIGVPARVHHVLEFLDEEGFPARVRCVFIKRDPRNVLVSWLRHNGYQVTPGMLMSHIRMFEQRADSNSDNPMAGPMAEVMRPFERWFTDDRALVVRYEDLIASDAELRRIAEWLRIEYVEGAFEMLPGMTATWSSKHSDWREVWTPQVQRVWEAEGGPDLLKRWGYA